MMSSRRSLTSFSFTPRLCAICFGFFPLLDSSINLEVGIFANRNSCLRSLIPSFIPSRIRPRDEVDDSVFNFIAIMPSIMTFVFPIYPLGIVGTFYIMLLPHQYVIYRLRSCTLVITIWPKCNFRVEGMAQKTQTCLRDIHCNKLIC